MLSVNQNTTPAIFPPVVAASASVEAKGVGPMLEREHELGKTITERDRDIAYEKYAWAYVALHAVDSPDSFHAALPESEKEILRAERRAKLREREAAYLHLKDKCEKNAARRAKTVAKRKEEIKRTAPIQAALFADAWPAPYAAIAARFPHKPYVTNNPKLGVEVRPLHLAREYSFIQYDPPAYSHMLIVDYDGKAGSGVTVDDLWKLAGVPAPNYIAITPGTGREHGHLAWAITAPVCTTDAARIKPIEYFARIEQGFVSVLHGDETFSGLLTKNPASTSWEMEWITPDPYTLDELAASVKIPRYSNKKQKDADVEPLKPFGHGRKVLTFHSVRKWAYTAVSAFWSVGYDGWHEAVREQVEKVNEQFAQPIPASHRKSIAKSIAKWVWRTFTPSSKALLVEAMHKPEVQAIRGRMKGAEKRQEAMEEALRRIAAGESRRTVAAALGVSHVTIANWLKRAATPQAPIAGLQ